MTTLTDDVTPDPITPVLTRRWLSPRSWDIDVYEQLEGYTALRHALTGHPDQLIELVKASGLRGRGGAGSARAPGTSTSTSSSRATPRCGTRSPVTRTSSSSWSRRRACAGAAAPDSRRA